DRLADPFNWRPRGGESYADLMTRLVPWIKEQSGNTVIASHGGISRALRGYFLNVDMNSFLELEVPQDRVLKISTDGMVWL
ncbi:MAG: histidine phosphatase family protein, partial [Pseudomonadota bacterium]